MHLVCGAPRASPWNPLLRPWGGILSKSPRPRPGPRVEGRTRGSGTGRVSRLFLLVEFLPGILQLRGDGLDFDVGELAADFAHLAPVFVLDDIARVRIDQD